MSVNTHATPQKFNAQRMNFSRGSAVLWNVTKLRGADDELVRALYTEFGTPLLRYVMGLVSGDRARAEDIVQETLLRAWKHPEVSASEQSPRAWLFTVARNLSIDEFRSRSARPTEVVEDESQPATDGGIAAALTRFEMQDAMSSLAPQHRDVLVALFFQDLTIAEAADALGVPEGTVKSRSHYALRALRILCAERGLLP